MRTHFCLLSALLLSAGSVAQQTITELEPLSFGLLAITDNSSVSSVTVLPSNTSASSNSIYVVKQGRAAELLFEGYGARIQVTISDNVNNQPLSNLHNNQRFYLNRLIYNPTLVTDSYGSAVLKVGGQISTSGDGSTYNDGYYDATVSLTVDF
ncbi:DUF4402 domain-containing protein [Pseudoalteromonas sp. PB2-1]|uniref:DUF4402 domain-containing protein n=1 Tax=Pseudoalteromonas sp. PB2-1 TaxID=2907242 RepID=UPI003863337E